MAATRDVRFELVDGGRLRISGDMRLAYHAPSDAQRYTGQLALGG